MDAAERAGGYARSAGSRREEAWNLLEYIATPYKTYDQKEFKQAKKGKNVQKDGGDGGKYVGGEEPWEWLLPAVED